MSGFQRPHIWLIAIICAHILLSAVYWHFTPFGVPPDEGPHALYVRQIAENHSLPVFNPYDHAQYEDHQPPLYYLLAVPFYWIGDGILVRLLSIILGALSILVIYLAVSRAFPDDPRLGIAAAGFTALLPTHVMLSSSVSNDILVELVFGLVLLVMTGLLRDGITPRRSIALGVVLGLGILTKTTCLILFPVALLAYIMCAKHAGIRNAFVHFLVALVTSLVIGGWWLVRNQMLYGDPLAASQFAQAFAHTAKPEYWLSRGITLPSYVLFVIAWTFCSFWGVFGHMKVFMPAWAYVGLGVAALAPILGTLIGLRRPKDDQQRAVIVLYNILLLLVVLAFIGFNLKYFQAQGRYLYPAILPIAAYWSLGIRRLLPERMSNWMPAIAIAIPLAAQIIALATCIIPKMPYQ